jgi:hypothetical protein
MPRSWAISHNAVQDSPKTNKSFDRNIPGQLERPPGAEPTADAGGCVNDLRLRAQMNHVICFDHGVQSEGRTAFPLAPTAMAAVHKERLLQQAIAHNAAIAASVERKDIFHDHAWLHPLGECERCVVCLHANAELVRCNRPAKAPLLSA